MRAREMAKAERASGTPARLRMVPASLKSPHFFYRIKAPSFEKKDVDLVVRAAQAYVIQNGIGVAEIAALGVDKLEASEAGAGEALRRLLTCIPGSLMRIGLDAVLVCEWASAHIDHAFVGRAFCSFVLGTGEHPYVMQTMHTTTVGGLLELVTCTRELVEGDAFVFDPLTPHMAVPKYSSGNQLLVLLQIEVEDRCEEDRARLLQAFPPTIDDHDDGWVIGS